MGEGPPLRYPGVPKSRISALPDSLLPNISRPVRPSVVQAFRLKPAARSVVVALHGGNHLIANVGAFLDSVCSHGLSNRFRILELSQERILAFETDAEAIKFLKMCHGVNGDVLVPSPADFPKGERFDFIFASPLFSHMRRSGFDCWIETLSNLLIDCGIRVVRAVLQCLACVAAYPSLSPLHKGGKVGDSRLFPPLRRGDTGGFFECLRIAPGSSSRRLKTDLAGMIPTTHPEEAVPGSSAPHTGACRARSG